MRGLEFGFGVYIYKSIGRRGSRWQVLELYYLISAGNRSHVRIQQDELAEGCHKFESLDMNLIHHNNSNIKQKSWEYRLTSTPAPPRPARKAQITPTRAKR